MARDNVHPVGWRLMTMAMSRMGCMRCAEGPGGPAVRRQGCAGCDGARAATEGALAAMCGARAGREGGRAGRDGARAGVCLPAFGVAGRRRASHRVQAGAHEAFFACACEAAGKDDCFKRRAPADAWRPPQGRGNLLRGGLHLPGSQLMARRHTRVAMATPRRDVGRPTTALPRGTAEGARRHAPPHGARVGCARRQRQYRAHYPAQLMAPTSQARVWPQRHAVGRRGGRFGARAHRVLPRHAVWQAAVRCEGAPVHGAVAAASSVSSQRLLGSRVEAHLMFGRR